MEVVKQRLAAIRSEENDLRDKLTELNNQIKERKSDNEEIQSQILSLKTRERLCKLKSDQQSERLKNITLKLSKQEELTGASEKKLENLTASTANLSNKEEDLAEQLKNLQDEVRQYQTQSDEVGGLH
ncbi:unnamed protein product [Calicophoron daubneyi]|uniref:Uncharacterized protein n=1 Tax=Calicophoron daubneyi TaxID=300641 RepID=A0AAV2TL31_CALDB